MQRVCKQCNNPFEIADSDIKFIGKISPNFDEKKYLITPPTLCPDCRMQRRLAFRNERKLYPRKCDLCGKQMISIFSPDKPYKVYCYDCWWSDKWDPFEYGRDFDFSRPFFEQFMDLWKTVPVIGLWNTQLENAEYNNNCFSLKNAYMSINSDYGENYYYCYITEHSKDILDSAYIEGSTLCYECLDCNNCYQCAYSRELRNCNDCYFSSDLIGCKNCIGCHGLRHKENYIFNKPASVQKFLDLRKTFGNSEVIEKLKKQSNEVYLKIPKKNLIMTQCENSTGDHLFGAKNCSNCFDFISGSNENIKNFIYLAFEGNNILDGYGIGATEWGYEIMAGGLGVSNVAFVMNFANGLSNAFYSVLCLNGSSDVFASISLKKKQYCIFNKQYSKEEYNKLVPKIIEHMKKTGEWGEFFPIKISPWAYNETVANEYFPLNKHEVQKLGGKWKEEEPSTTNLKANSLPSYNINDVSPDIINKVLKCSTCGKGYKIIQQEYDLYIKMNLPIPENCYNCRYEARMNLRNPRKLFDRKCAKCGTSIKTTYSPERPEIVYCEACYLKVVY